MKWQIPAKTFLLGEYAALAEASAIILTTTPYFELSLSHQKECVGIHPDSPAGIWWQQQGITKGLLWQDPYQGHGGLGASSAQFLAAFFAACHLNNKTPELRTVLEAYYQSSWSGKGLRPSGYDVIAQSQHACVYINKQNKIIHSYAWPFKDLSFLLIHTGVKLATHHHLQDTTLPPQIDYLSAIVDTAKEAFEHIDSQKLIHSINNYHQKLTQLNRVAPYSLECINTLNAYPEIVGIKGCGALGADVLLVLTSRQDAPSLKNKLLAKNWSIVATETNLTPVNKNSLSTTSL